MTDMCFTPGEPAAVAAHERAAWRGAAPLYSDFIAPFTAFSGQLQIHLKQALIGPTDHILDVGCGTGDLSDQLAAHVESVIGIDFADTMIAEAKRRHPRIEFYQSDAEELPFGDGQFDVVIVNYCAHHLARPEVVFAEIRRVLKSSGWLSLIHPIQTAQPSWGSFVRASEAVLPSQALFGGPLLMVDSPQSYVDYLEAAGFRDIVGRRQVKPIEMATLEPILRGGWAVASLDNQPPEVQEEIRSGVIDNAAPFRRSDGSYRFPDEVIVVAAVA